MAKKKSRYPKAVAPSTINEFKIEHFHRNHTLIKKRPGSEICCAHDNAYVGEADEYGFGPRLDISSPNKTSAELKEMFDRCKISKDGEDY